MTTKSITQIIRERRSVFPPSYIDKPIAKADIEEILENANWAPNHKKTEPWRFIVFQGAALERLSAYMGNWYEQNIPAEKYSEIKHKKWKKNPLSSACVIAICMQREPAESLPEWEEISAVACAVQNMWLTCTEKGIGSYWSSPRAITEDANEFLELEGGQRCLGLFYMGYYDNAPAEGKRTPIADKVKWLNN